MKTLIYIFLVTLLLPVHQLSADDKGPLTAEDYEIMINNYIETSEIIEYTEFATTSQVIIYDSMGNITRQIDINEDLEFTTPAILKPVICNAEFLTKIDGNYYYMCNKM